MSEIEARIDAPAADPSRLIDIRAQQGLEHHAGHIAEAVACQMRRHPLTVAHMEPPPNEMLMQRRDRDLGGVLDGGELRLAEPYFADGEPEQLARELAISVPDFDRMGVARFMRGEERS
jgi:hypothetical protein